MNGTTNLSFGACVIIAVMEFMYMISGKNVLILGSSTPRLPFLTHTHFYFSGWTGNTFYDDANNDDMKNAFGTFFLSLVRRVFNILLTFNFFVSSQQLYSELSVSSCSSLLHLKLFSDS